MGTPAQSSSGLPSWLRVSKPCIGLVLFGCVTWMFFSTEVLEKKGVGVLMPRARISDMPSVVTQSPQQPQGANQDTSIALQPLSAAIETLTFSQAQTPTGSASLQRATSEVAVSPNSVEQPAGLYNQTSALISLTPDAAELFTGFDNGASALTSSSGLDHLESSLRCIEPAYNRSCMFRNIYWVSDPNTNTAEFTMLQLRDTADQLNDGDHSVKLADKYWGPWVPRKLVFDSREQMQVFIQKHEVEHQKGLSLLFQGVFHQNIGHALFDSLYPAFLALLKFGRFDSPFKPIVAADHNCWDEAERAMEQGTEVEAYIPQPSRRTKRSIRPVKVRIVQIGDAVRRQEQCDFIQGEDDSGENLGRVTLSMGGQQHAFETLCCDLCRRTDRCHAAVLLIPSCFLKGPCAKGPGKCGYPRHEGQVACRLRPVSPAEQGLTIVQTAHGQNFSVPPFWILGPVRRRCRSEYIFEQFADGGSLTRVYEMERDSIENPDLMIKFDALIAGSGNMGNMVMEPSIAMAGSLAPWYGTALMRDRMMRTYGVEPRYKGGGLGRGGVGMQRPLPNGEQIQAIIVDNKRFSANDKRILHDAIKQWNEEANGLVNARYIIWPDVGDYAAHMRLVGQTHIYISSPGTALQYVPFMWDGGVFVALGAPMKRYGRAIPSFVEQQLAGGGTPYLRTIYYDSAEMMRPTQGKGDFLNKSSVINLFRQAQELVQVGVKVPVDVPENLSIEGLLTRELCEADRSTCETMFAQQNSLIPPGQCVADNWLECIVYELGGFAEDGYNGEKCAVNRPLLRRLRKKYGLLDYGIPESRSIFGFV